MGSGFPCEKGRDGGINEKNWAGKRDLRSLLGTLYNQHHPHLYFSCVSWRYVRMILFLADHWTSTIHTTQEELNSAKITKHFGFMFEENSVTWLSRDYCDVIIFEKLSFQNVFPQYENEKRPFSNFFMSFSMVTQSLSFKLLWNYHSPADNDFICMLWKNNIGFQVDHTVSTMTTPPA